MILEGIIKLFLGMVNGLMSIIPTIKLPDGFLALLGDVNYIFSLAAYFLPIPTILICVSVILIIDNIKFLMSIFNWIISKIPTIN